MTANGVIRIFQPWKTSSERSSRTGAPKRFGQLHGKEIKKPEHPFEHVINGSELRKPVG
jgi:hypothetical protein